MTVQTLSNTWFLFTNQTTDANSDPVSVNYANKTAIIKVWGTFGGANVKFQTLAPQSSPNVWIDIPDMNGTPITFSSNKQSVIEFLVQNEQVRAVLTSSSGTTTINASLEIY